MRNIILTVLGLVVLIIGGCAQSLYMQGRRHLEAGEYDPAIKAFYQELSEHPKNADAWRELGVSFYYKGDLAKAEQSLKEAAQIKPSARTHLFLGMVFEKQEEYDKAIDAFGASLALGSSGRTAEVTRDHLKRLTYKTVQMDITRALKNEEAIGADQIPENSIAVPDFDGSHLPPELSSIALGLSLLTAGDLSKVRSLKVVERSKIDILQKELKLGTSGYVDPGSAPRVGRLMKSRRIVTASVMALGDKGLKLDGAVVNTTDSGMVVPSGVEGKLESVFDLQKKFVFNIIDSLGIELTPEERDAIQKRPTESYLAFLAYCRGLDYRRRGMESAARTEFGKALELDPGFSDAEVEMNNDVTIYSDNISLGDSFEMLEDVIGQEGGSSGDGGFSTDNFITGLPGEMGVVGGSTTGDNSGVTGAQVKPNATVTIEGNLDAN